MVRNAGSGVLSPVRVSWLVSLRRKIDAGTARSRFGILVLSSAPFARGWAQYDLDGLVTIAISGKQVWLPLWHGVSKDCNAELRTGLAPGRAIQSSIAHRCPQRRVDRALRYIATRV